MSVFGKLTDTSQYTGAHAKRFDAGGKGRGIKGRTDSTEATAARGLAGLANRKAANARGAPKAVVSPLVVAKKVRVGYSPAAREYRSPSRGARLSKQESGQVSAALTIDDILVQIYDDIHTQEQARWWFSKMDGDKSGELDSLELQTAIRRTLHIRLDPAQVCCLLRYAWAVHLASGAYGVLIADRRCRRWSGRSTPTRTGR